MVMAYVITYVLATRTPTLHTNQMTFMAKRVTEPIGIYTVCTYDYNSYNYTRSLAAPDIFLS